MGSGASVVMPSTAAESGVPLDTDTDGGESEASVRSPSTEADDQVALETDTDYAESAIPIVTVVSELLTPWPGPVLVPAFPKFIAVSAGGDHTCALLIHSQGADNEVVCWETMSTVRAARRTCAWRL